MATPQRPIGNARVRRRIPPRQVLHSEAHVAEARRLSTPARNAFFIWGPEQAYTTGVRLASVSLQYQRKARATYSQASRQGNRQGFLMTQSVLASEVQIGN